jgi:hypothetical protein
VLKLAIRAARGREHRLDRQAQGLRGTLHADAVAAHDREHPALQRIQLGDQVQGAQDTIASFHKVKRLVLPGELAFQRLERNPAL